MNSVTIQAGSEDYIALIGKGLLDQVGALIAEQFVTGARKLDGLKPSSFRPSKCAIISDTNTGALFADRIKASLTNAGFQPVAIAIPAGEESKTLEQAGEICDDMIAAGLDRQSFVIGLGGGVIGDISGFVAAIFQRGIPHLQIPTTLLAMVDSSIGGKTGVNTHAGKNLIGAVHQPSLVIDDVDLLKSLPLREFNQGFAEIIKHAIIADAEMFNDLTKAAPPKLDRLNRSSLLDGLIPLIRRSIEIKSSVVAKDELDRSGERAILNFGHTIGHGIERAGDYHRFLHGEAISLGMVAAAAISMKKVGLTTAERAAIVDLLRKFDLPTRLPERLSREKILDALKFDKKFERGEIRFVVTPGIGSAYLSRDITMDDIREAVDKL